jgi:hypothetical protein
MFSVEIVSHCWAAGPNGDQYAKALRYQIRSLFDNPPQHASVLLTVCCAEPEDDKATWDVIYREGRFSRDGLMVQPQSFIKSALLQRPHGRNAASLRSKADVVFFTDCDYFFGDSCLDSLAQISGRSERLFFPEVTRICRNHETGDKYLATDEPLPIDEGDFVYKKERKAIGGIQIVSGDVARQYGYCKDVAKYQRPAPPDCNTVIGFSADAKFRKILGTRGTPFKMENLFRIRHSLTGDGRVPKELANEQA